MIAPVAYPLVVRNRVPGMQRLFTLLWLGTVAVITVSAWRAAPPDGSKLWPWMLLLFWLVGLVAVRWSFSVEAARLTVRWPGEMRLDRGTPFRRQSMSLQWLRLRFVETEDSEGALYFHLVIDAPGGSLVIAESHRRARLIDIEQRLKRAFDGDPG